ncbi:YhcN/YlaJ family sporulation lipoprotein [Hydrogenibacillus schlegelii]|uniref:YhcN/YlaJ family sporulation lipoprotein n=1 Tax=Hydrogenibacillus schlegelii TaxID=1484 RepID=A0A179IRV5_HYDSH|nr:hypothetical protein SA87_07005 [Hydrogenibacillus schlegelii]
MEQAMKKPLLPLAALGLAAALAACTPQQSTTGMGERTPTDVTYRGTAPQATPIAPDGAARMTPGTPAAPETAHPPARTPGMRPTATGERVPSPGPWGTPNPNALPDLNAVATRMAGTAASVPGVNRATAVIVGNTAYVGLDIGDAVPRDQALRIERTAADRVARAYPEYNIRVTSDKGLMQRIGTLGERLRGTPDVTRYRSDIEELDRHLAPAAR